MPFEDLPVTNVDISSPFWVRIQECARDKTIPAIVEAQKASQHWYCLTWREGHPIKPHPFWDSDVYKTVEAACIFLMKYPDEKMMATVDEAVEMIRNAQHEDGYLNSYYTVHGLDQRWTNLRDMHELYCLGHLVEATVAYETLARTGKLLEVVMKALRHVDSIFGAEEGKKRGYPGHQEIEIGLLRLYELTRDPLPLKLATYFLNERGQHDENYEIYFDHESRARGADPYADMGSEHKSWYHGPRDYGYHQAAQPLTEQSELEGHSVRAMYYYTAATDLVRIRGGSDEYSLQIMRALSSLWRDLVDKKIYVTGAIGSVTQWEGFGPAYVLNNLESEGCYGETCAAFALIMWCQRLLKLQLRSEYADVMEVCLYNAFLGAMSASGDAFYYQNVLRTLADEKKERSKWFGVACCPPNVAKLLGSLSSLIYSYDPIKELVAIHLYVQSKISVPNTNVQVSLETNMPWDGQVSIHVKGGPIRLALRIPSWASASEYTCSVPSELKHGYLHVETTSDIVVDLNLPLKARKVYTHPKLGKDEFCIMRGPLVYCIEDVDNEDMSVDDLALLDVGVKDGESTEIASIQHVVPIVAQGRQLERPNEDALYTSRPWLYEATARDVVAIPYFLRSNRGGNGAMRVWTRRLEGPSLNGH